jgi:hypothetical protein
LAFVVLRWVGLRTTPVAGLILLPPGIQFKAVKGDPLATDADLGKVGADLGVEEIAVHAEVVRRVPQPQHSRH